MGEELKQAAAGASEATPEATPTGETATTPTEGATPTASPDLKTMIAEAVQEVRAEYEGKGGHLAKLRSSYDKQIAELKKQVSQQQRAKMEQAQGLLEAEDYEEAAKILYSQMEELQGQTMRESQKSEMADWVDEIMTDLGYDLEEDKEAATLAAGWLDRLVDDPRLTWEFQQEVARKLIEDQQAAAKAAQKELAKFKDDLPSLIKSQVAQLLTDAGFAPDTAGDGAAPTRTTDLTQLSEAELWKLGTAQRRAARKTK